MPAPEVDKRKGKPRIARRLPVRFGTEAKMCGGSIIDISEGGMRIESPESFPVNSVITVFVQFPRHAVRLRARVAWGGGGAESASTTMGLALTQPEPTLKRVYGEWIAEVKQAAQEAAAESRGPAAGAPEKKKDATSPAAAAPATGAPAAPATAAAAAAPPTPAQPEPRGPVRRRLESRQGQSYEAVLEREPQGWTLTIVQLPRQLGVGAPDFQTICPDYAGAEKALREFVRSH